MTKQTLLIVFSLFITSGLFAQPPGPFSFDPACTPNLFGSDPLFTGIALIDGVPAEPNVDYVAVLDANNNIIFSGPVQTVTINNQPFAGFGFRLISETSISGCPGYSDVDPVTVVIYDASAVGCQYFTATNSSFVVTVADLGGTDFVEGPDGDATTTDTYDFSSASCFLPLPVQFAAFRARANESNAVDLSWATGEEINNSHFEVQRSSADARWETIGTVAGNGTTRNNSSYTFVDHFPTAGSNLYRLKQIDFDGTFTYSPIVVVEISATGRPGGVQVFPNPITGSVASISLTGNWGTRISAELLNSSGRKVATFNDLQAGSTTIDLPELPSGVYQLLVRDQSQRKVIRVAIR